MYSHASPATSIRLPLPIQAGCKFVGSRWSASFSHTSCSLLPEHRVQEGLTACEIELLHPGFFQELHSALGLVQGEDAGGLLGVEAEAAFVVAFAGEVVVDRDRSFGCTPLLKLMGVV